MPRATRNAVRLSSRTRWFVRRLRPVLKFSILLSFMRIENPLCDSIRRRKRKSVTPQFAECNSFVNLWTAGGRLQNARYLLAPIGGLLFGRETEVASEVWVRQMNKRAEPIVETGQAAFNCRGQPSQLVVSACQSAFRLRRRRACCTVDRWESFARFARGLRHTLRGHAAELHHADFALRAFWCTWTA